MIKIKTNPKTLLSCGFTGIRFIYNFNVREQEQEIIRDWILGMLTKDDCYAIHDGVFFVRIDGFETMAMIMFPGKIHKIYKQKEDWN